MSSDAMLNITGTTIDMIVDTSAPIAEITEMPGGIVNIGGGTAASGEGMDGGVSEATHELPGCTGH